MATRINVLPAEDYFVAFLATRGVTLCMENPDVIHYFGDSKRKLKKIVADSDPDLVVLHNPKAFAFDFKFPFVLDEVHNDRDIYLPKQVSTNAMDLARLHYQSLGLERLLHDLNEKRERERKEKLQINASAVKKVFAAMMWD